MENYTRSEVVHIDDKMPLDAHPSTVHMKVTNGSKIRNLLGFALKKIKEDHTRQITWNAQGDAINKAISCAEIMKKKVKKLHQTTNIRFLRTEEYWEPKLEGLERLKVNKDVPAVTVLLSKDELNTNDLSYQAPGAMELFSAKSATKTQKVNEHYQKKSWPSSGNKKSQFTPPAMDRKRKRKGDSQHFIKSNRNEGQAKMGNKDGVNWSKSGRTLKENKNMNSDRTHGSSVRAEHGNAQCGDTSKDNTAHGAMKQGGDTKDKRDGKMSTLASKLDDIVKKTDA